VPHFTELDGVIFSESALEGQFIAPIEVRTSGQNSTLIDLKKEMAARARVMGGNAISGFTYGQKADRGRNLFKWDTERLVGSGSIMLISNPPTE